MMKNNILPKSEEIEQIKRIITYLNRKTGRTGRSKFKYKSRRYQKLIMDRFSEGYKPEDFKYVIDVKVTEWLYDEKMNVYLRPSTLFSPKFKVYVMQKPVKRKYEVQ